MKAEEKVFSCFVEKFCWNNLTDSKEKESKNLVFFQKGHSFKYKKASSFKFKRTQSLLFFLEFHEISDFLKKATQIGVLLLLLVLLLLSLLLL